MNAIKPMPCCCPVCYLPKKQPNTTLAHNADKLVLLQISTNALFQCGEGVQPPKDAINAFRPEPAGVDNTTPASAVPAPSPNLLSPLSPWGQYASRSAGRPPLSRPAPQVCTAFHLVIDLSNGNRVWAACATDSGWPRCAMVCGAVHAQQ